MKDNILKQVGNYYTEKLNTHGATPQGVDWNSAESQWLRFEVLSNVISVPGDFSMLDYGCGFGSMYEFIKEKYVGVKFRGYDISEAMIDEARKKHTGSDVSWSSKLAQGEKFDFVVASGIFNVRLTNNDEDWKQYIIETVHELNNLSKKGFSFNVLTSYSDKEFMKDYLHYASPADLFDYCKKNFSKRVALLHDYPLYEFTIIVRK